MDWVSGMVMVGAAASCLIRASVVREERLAWALLGLALAVWTAGEIYYEVALPTQGSVPVPSPADVGYLLFYPIAYAGLIVLLRHRLDSFSAARWLDGIIVGAAVAALAAALALHPIVDASTRAGDTVAVATNLAYPIGDLALLALVATAAALGGWRLNPRWMVLGAGLIVLAVSDGTTCCSRPRGPTSKAGSSTPPGRSAPCCSPRRPGSRRPATPRSPPPTPPACARSSSLSSAR